MAGGLGLGCSFWSLPPGSVETQGQQGTRRAAEGRAGRDLATRPGERPRTACGGSWPPTATRSEPYKRAPRAWRGRNPGRGRVRTSGNMRAGLVALLALVLGPGARAAWLGRLDPTQVTASRGVPPPLGRPGPARPARAAWGPGLPAGEGPPRLERAPLTGSCPAQLLGSWYVVAVASGERGFAVEKATKNIEGVVVTLTPENNLRVQSSRHR